MTKCKSGFPHNYSTQCPCGHKYLSWSFAMRKKPTPGLQQEVFRLRVFWIAGFRTCEQT
jgi:hypothetical protein